MLRPLINLSKCLEIRVSQQNDPRLDPSQTICLASTQEDQILFFQTFPATMSVSSKVQFRRNVLKNYT